MAEEIVTRFTADLTDLQAKVKEATSILEGYTETADEAGNAVAAQGKKVGDLEAKTKALIGTEKAVTVAVNQQTDAIEASRQAAAKVVLEANDLTEAEKKAAAAAGGITKEYEALVAAAKKAAPPIREQLGLIQQIQSRITLLNQKKLSLTDPKEIARTNREIQQFEGRLRNLNRLGGRNGGLGGLATQARGLRGALTGAVDSLDSAGLSTGRLSGLVRGLASPLGAAVGLVGGLVYNFLQLDSAKVTIDGIGRGFSNMLAVLRNVNGGISQIVEGFTEGMRLAREQDALDLQLEKVKILNAEAERSSEALIRQARDRSLTEDQRIAKLEEANKIIQEGSEASLAAAKEQARIQTETFIQRLISENTFTTTVKDALKQVKAIDASTIDWLKNLTDVSGEFAEVDDEALKAATDASAAFIAADNARSNIIEANQARINSLREQGDNEEKQRLDKAEQDRQKAFEKEKERIEKLAQLREQAANVQTDLDRDALRRQTLGEDGAPTLSTQVIDVDFKVEDQINAAKENAKQQEELAKGNAAELERIARELAETIALIREQGNAEVDALTAKFYKSEEEKAKAAKDRVTDALLSDTDQQIAAVNKQYDELITSLSTFITDEDELNRLRIALNKKRQEEINNILITGRVSLKQQLLETGAEFVGEAAGFLATSQAQLREQIDAINETYSQQLLDLQKFAGTEAEIQEERARINGERNRAINEAEKAQGKQRTKILLDTLQKVLTILIGEVVISQVAKGGAAGGVPGAIAGEAQAAIITALLQGVFSALLSSIGGAYMGERNIGGAPDIPGVSRDQYLRRVDRGEDIVRAKMARKHRGPLDAIHDDKFDQWLQKELALTMPDFGVMPAINNYLEGDTGQRMTAAISLPRGWDRGTVEATNRVAKEQKHTNDLLLLIAQGPNNKRSLRAR